MTPIASRMLRGALRASRRPRPDCLAIAEMLESVLELEGEEPEPGQEGGPKSAAERMRDYRARKKGAGGDGGDAVTRESVTETRNEVTSLRGGGLGGGVSSSLLQAEPSKTLTPSRSVGVQGGALRHEVTRERNAPIAASDFGMLTDAWLEAMRTATGQGSWSRRGQALGSIRVLDGVLDASAPAEGDRLAWAREVASEYALAEGRLSIFGFQTWLQSGKVSRPAPRGRPAKAGEVEGNPNPVSRRFELTPHDEARIEAAQERRRVEEASRRGESSPLKLGGSRT